MAKIPFRDAIIPIIITITLFLVALSFNDAIVSSIIFFSDKKRGITLQEVTNKWLYSIVAIIILFSEVMMWRDYLPGAFKESKDELNKHLGYKNGSK